MIQAPPIIGYFLGEDNEPRFDPGECPCPFCLEDMTKWGDEVRTFLSEVDSKIYHFAFFWRAHKKCANEATEKEMRRIEEMVSLMTKKLILEGEMEDD